MENLQRADLNAIEEAEAYDVLATDRRPHAGGESPPRVGKERSTVSSTRSHHRLLKLPEEVRDAVRTGQLDMGHARALLAVAEPDAVADRIVARRPERARRRAVGRARRPVATPSQAQVGHAGRRRHARASGQARPCAWDESDDPSHRGESGDIRIAFRNFDQLDDFCRRLLQPPPRA